MASVESEFEPTEQDVQHMREWIMKMPHLVKVQDDHILRTLIRASKGSLQKCKVTYEKFNSLGVRFPNMFGHLDPLDEITQYYLNNVYIFLMPEKTDNGCTVLITASKPGEIDGDKYSVMEIARFIFMSFMILLWEDVVGESKFIFVYDCQHAKLSEMKGCTPMFLKHIANFVLNFPVRFQGGHFVNVPKVFLPSLNFLKSFLSQKISDRIHLHSSMDELNEMMPKKSLPKEFGGYGDDLATLHNSWKKKLESYRDRLVSENDKMRKLDHLRPKSNDDDDDDDDELQGSFRKLEVD